MVDLIILAVVVILVVAVFELGVFLITVVRRQETAALEKTLWKRK